MLNMMVEESTLTLKEIAEKCVTYGVKVNPSYISKLKSGKQPPASDEVNIALAKSCGYEDEVDSFLFESYLEKAPEYIKDFLNELITLFRTTIKITFEKQFPSEMIHILQMQLDQFSNYEILTQSIEQLRNTTLVTDVDALSNQQVINTTLKMNDTSMEPLIPKGSILHIRKDNEIINDDIIVIEKNGDFLVRRIFFIEENKFLYSINKSYKSEFLNDNIINIIGKVEKITIEL